MSMKDNGTVIGVAIDEIDPELRPAKFMRHWRSDRVIEEYMEILDELAPVRLIHDMVAGVLWVADGFHTISAAKKAGRKDVRAIIKAGTLLDAWNDGSRANDGRGVRTGTADKRHRVEQFLETPEGKDMLNKDVASVLNVTHQYVSQIRRSLCNPCVSIIREMPWPKMACSDDESDNGESNGEHDPLPGQTSFLDAEEEEEPKVPLISVMPNPEDLSDQAAIRWQKLISDYCVLIDSVRRRGGGKALARNWSTEHIGQTISLVDRMISGFQEIRNGFCDCLEERD